MGKLRQLSPELWPLIYVILFSYIELFFRGGVSCLPAALLLKTVQSIAFRRFEVVMFGNILITDRFKAALLIWFSVFACFRVSFCTVFTFCESR